MSFKDRRRPETSVKEIKEVSNESANELPVYKKLILKKKSAKAVRKLKSEQKTKETFVPTKTPNIILASSEHIHTTLDFKHKAEDTKLALIGTTETATTFRSIVKKKRLTITEVLEKLLTSYINENKLEFKN